jgi:hypothetical protein
MPRAQPIDKVRALLKTQQDDARARIQVGRAVETVQKIMGGEIVGEPAMLNVRLAAAKTLLQKTLPDLSSVEMTGEGGGPLTITINKIA